MKQVLVFFVLLFTGCSTILHNGTASRPPVYMEINPVQADSLMKSTPGLVVIDLRAETAFPGGHLPEAVNIQPDAVKKLDRNETYLIYCGGDGRSTPAFANMKELGFSEVYRLVGGFRGWMAWGYAQVR